MVLQQLTYLPAKFLIIEHESGNVPTAAVRHSEKQKVIIDSGQPNIFEHSGFAFRMFIVAAGYPGPFWRPGGTAAT